MSRCEISVKEKKLFSEAVVLSTIPPLHSIKNPLHCNNIIPGLSAELDVMTDFHLFQATAVRNVMFYPCCPEPFPDVTFWLHLRRRTAHYTLNVILPCVMLSVLTLTTFFLPADSGEKVTLGLTVLLSFSVFNLLIAENMPAKSDSVPLLGESSSIIPTQGNCFHQ